MTTLNCADYQVYVAERNEGPLVCKLAPIDIAYSRTLNDFSQATIETAVNVNCENCLSFINPWEHEVLIFRDSTLVWVGPIVNMRFALGGDRVRLNCRDLLAWTERRHIEITNEDFEVEEVDIKEIFEWVLSHGYNKDPWGMNWSLADTGIPLSRFYPGYFDDNRWGGLYPKVAAELRALSQAGIDYTVINRTLYAGDLVVTPPTDTLLQLADQNWVVTPEIVIDGARMANDLGVGGGQGGFYGWYDDQIWFERDTESQERYGLLQDFVVRQDLGDSDTTSLPNAIAQEAYGRSKYTAHPISYIEGGQLAGDSAFDFNELVPGVPIVLGLQKAIRNPTGLIENNTDDGSLVGNYRLNGVSVRVGADDETINVSVIAPGAQEVRV